MNKLQLNIEIQYFLFPLRPSMYTLCLFTFCCFFTISVFWNKTATSARRYMPEEEKEPPPPLISISSQVFQLYYLREEWPWAKTDTRSKLTA